MKLLFAAVFLFASSALAKSGLVQISSVYNVTETKQATPVIGTGLVFQARGKTYVLTASHVMSGATVRVQTERGEVPVKSVFFVDRVTDGAVLELDAVVETPFSFNEKSHRIEADSRASFATSSKSLSIASVPVDPTHFVPVLHTKLADAIPYTPPKQEMLIFSPTDGNHFKDKVTETPNGTELRAYAGIRPGMSGAPLIELENSKKLFVVKGITTSYNSFFKISFFSKIENVLVPFVPGIAEKINLDATWGLSQKGFFRTFSNGYSENVASSFRAGKMLLTVGQENNSVALKNFAGGVRSDGGGVRSDGGQPKLAGATKSNTKVPDFYEGKDKFKGFQMEEILQTNSEGQNPSPKPKSMSDAEYRETYREWNDLGLFKNGQRVLGFRLQFRRGLVLSLLANESALIFIEKHRALLSSIEDISNTTNLTRIALERYNQSGDQLSSKEYFERKQAYCFVSDMDEGAFDIEVVMYNRKSGRFWELFPTILTSDPAEEPVIMSKKYVAGKYTGDDTDSTGIFFTDLSQFDKSHFDLAHANEMSMYVSIKNGASNQRGEGRIACEARRLEKMR